MSVPRPHNARTAEYRARYVPGYEALLRMTAQVVAESAAAHGTVLVLGAGGGLELEALSRAGPGWRFLAVDPDREMLDAARTRVHECRADDRVTWVDGFVFDAPNVRCDAATCLLTLHFVPDDGAKLATLRAVRERLQAGAPLVLVDISLDRTAADFDQWVDRYYTFGLNGGIEAENMQGAADDIRSGALPMVSPERMEKLLGEAGFERCQLFYAAFAWRGWIAFAGTESQ
jgi:tRNA (cmo5U34)-methyltransferase